MKVTRKKDDEDDKEANMKNKKNYNKRKNKDNMRKNKDDKKVRSNSKFRKEVEASDSGSVSGMMREKGVMRARLRRVSPVPSSKSAAASNKTQEKDIFSRVG